MTPALAARALFPPAVTVAGGRLPDWQGDLHESEAQAVARARGPRRAEFTAGRMAARAALGYGGPLPRRADGPPVWPAGRTGSIAHGGGWVLAAVARLSDHAALGVDIEPADALTAELCGTVLTGAEAAALGGQDPTRAFCAKEAAYKAQFMQTGRMLGFHDVTLAWRGDDFSATLPGMVVQGRVVQAAGMIVAAVTVPP
jgi:4'-phosphopantetheinyl transferase EntD